MRHAALTLMALSALSACADATDAGVPTYNNALAYYNPANPGTANPGTANPGAPNGGTANNNPPFFTTDPAYFANPPAYTTDPYYLAMVPYYYTNAGYFTSPTRVARYAYCPPRGGRGFSHARGGHR
jgi:hypothetical protein